MAFPFSVTTRADGTVLTSAIYNGDRQEIANNITPGNTDDYSNNVSQMQLKTDPGEPGTESLAIDLAGEIERLRFKIHELASRLNGSNLIQWYQSPTGDLQVADGGTGASDAATARANLGALAKSGDTMTGLLTLSGDPTAALHAATKQYVDSRKTLYMVVEDRRATGTPGGNFNAGIWNNRTLNTVSVNEISGASLDTTTNEIILPPGDYYITANAPAYSVNRHAIRLVDGTNNVVLRYGTSEVALTNVENRSFLDLFYQFTSTTRIKIQHRCEVTRIGDGFGVATNFSDYELYTVVTIAKRILA